MTTPRKVHGVDLSHHNALVDFAVLLASGVLWAYHKATEGAGFVDDRYEARRVKAKNAGMPFGAYHFALPDGGDAREEARHFKAHASLDKTQLLPCLDLERVGPWSDHPMEHLTDWVGDFIDEVGEPCIIYTPYSLKRYFGSPIWRPRYNDSNTPPVQDDWSVWQFSNGDAGVPDHIAGAGHCDLNTHRPGFTLEDLLRGDDVALSDADIEKIADAVWNRHGKNHISGTTSQAEALLSRIHQRTFNTLALVEAIAAQQMTAEEITEVINAAIAAGIDIDITVTPGD